MTDMKKEYIGIDLGTSSVKVLLITAKGTVARAKCAYSAADPEGWRDALCKAVAELKKTTPLTDVAAISLSSQVGTYITDGGKIVSWSDTAGEAELAEIRGAVSDDEWLQEIEMLHPALISYPLPRLLYIKRHFPRCKAVMMPKEWLIRELTGELVTDCFSWRGLCHTKKKTYSSVLLKRFGIDCTLPSVASPTDRAGYVTETAADRYGLPVHTPVYVGCNDFFAGLLGMGVWKDGAMFELSGTSEHIGAITECRKEGAFVSGPFFNGYATYGGTKASGVACDFAIQQFGIDGVTIDTLDRQPPIFLPYLRGERAPIYNENARGVFFGISDTTERQDMAYAVLEGVVFSLYHISESLGLDVPKRIITGGGSARNGLMATLKAALFGGEVVRVRENDASALGAAMLAMVGDGAVLSEVIENLVTYETMARPNGELQKRLLERYAIYKKLYTDVADTFEDFARLKGEKQ